MLFSPETVIWLEQLRYTLAVYIGVPTFILVMIVLLLCWLSERKR